MKRLQLIDLLNEARQCQVCAGHLSHPPRPVLRASSTARILIIGQAPGSRVHASGVPWDDPSGDRLRKWLSIDKQTFYDDTRVAIIPMGFCYPGKGSSGDLPPRPECAPKWHEALISKLPEVRLTLLIGHYAQRYYLSVGKTTLTATVASWEDYLPQYFPLPHPSPRNQIWLKRNAWFEQEVVPELRLRVQQIFD